MRTAIALICLFFSTSAAFCAQLQDPPGFPEGWEHAMEQSCTTAGGLHLSRDLYARDGKEFFVTNEKNSVRFLQEIGTFDKDGISWVTQVQKGDQVLTFQEERDAFGAAVEALGIPVEEYIDCFQNAPMISHPVKIRD